MNICIIIIVTADSFPRENSVKPGAGLLCLRRVIFLCARDSFNQGFYQADYQLEGSQQRAEKVIAPV